MILSTPINLDISQMVVLIVNATIGGFLNVLMWAKKPEDVTRWESVKTVIIGTIVGYVYWWAYAYHGVPDGLMSIVAGYTAKDFIDWITEKAPWSGKRGLGGSGGN